MLNRFLGSLQHRALPKSFNFDYLFTGLKIVIEGAHCFCTAMALKLLYDNFDMF